MATAKLHAVPKAQPYGDERDTVVVLKAPGKQEPPHPATQQMSKAFDWLVGIRRYMAEGMSLYEADQIVCEAIKSRRRGKQWTRDGKPLS